MFLDVLGCFWCSLGFWGMFLDVFGVENLRIQMVFRI